MDKLVSDQSSSAGTEESSHIGKLLEKTGPHSTDSEDTAILEVGDRLGGEAVTLPREVFNRGVRIHNAEAVAAGRFDQIMLPVLGPDPCDEYGNRFSRQGTVHTISSDDGSSLSPPPTTSYGGSEISFPSQTPRERGLSPLPTTNYEGSLMGLPPSTLPQDTFSTPRVSAGIIVRRYIESEENASQHAEKEGGVEETRKVYTPIPRKFEVSNSSDNEDDVMTEVEWRDEEPYMMPTKKGKKRNKRKGVERPVTPERPIQNMPQTPSRRKLEADWAKPAESLANENEPADLGRFIGEYLQDTNGLRDFMVGQERNDASYDIWCQQQSQHIAVRQNHTDAAVGSTRKIAQNIPTEVELEREYAGERAEKLDDRLSKIEKKLAKIAPVNMAKTIENALSGCMEKMINHLTDRVVKRLEEAAEEERKKGEIRRGKHVEATPENEDMSDIEFEPGATFSEKENEKVARVLELREVEKQELEASKHALVIPPGEKRQEFPRCTLSGQVAIAKRPVIAPAVPEQKKKEVKKLEVKEIPKGPKAGEKKKPEVKKPAQQQPAKKPEEKNKETWAQRAAAPPPKKQPEQRQQQQQSGQQQKKKGDGFVEVKRQQKKDDMKPVPPGQNSMEKRRVSFKRDNGLPLSQKKDLDISSEVNRALFEAKVPHFVRIQGVTKNTRGCLSTITTPAATAEMLIRYREIVINAARNVDAGIVDIETNEL